MYSIRIILHVPNTKGTANTKSTYGWLDASLSFSKDEPKPISPKTFKDRNLALEGHKFCKWMNEHGQVPMSRGKPKFGFHKDIGFTVLIDTSLLN